MQKIFYSLEQAAAATGQHKTTILKALQTARIRSTKNAHGDYKIAANDLYAVFGESAYLKQQTQPEEFLRSPQSDQQVEQINDLRSTIEDLQRRLDQANEDRRQLEADRRKTDDNIDGQMNRLTQLLAMKEQTINEQSVALQLEQSKPAPQLSKRKLTLTERLFGGEVEQVAVQAD